jgi:hypothetical protein
MPLRLTSQEKWVLSVLVALLVLGLLGMLLL